MDLVFGIIIIVFSLLAWLGQLITAFSYKQAVKWGLAEPEADIDPAFFADVRGEAIWDSLTLWTLPVAGILFLLNNPNWPYIGVVGGGTYIYFAGRGIFVRLAMQSRGIRIGKPETIKIAYTFLSIWGLIALIIMFMAITYLKSLFLSLF